MDRNQYRRATPVCWVSGRAVLRLTTRRCGRAGLLLLRLADVCGSEPMSAAKEKIARNEQRYPTARARVNGRKYTQFSEP